MVVNAALLKELEKITAEDIYAELWRRGDLGFLLHSAQQAYRQQLQSQPGKTHVLHCGRGWGKTWYYLVEEVLSFGIRNPKSRIIYATQTRDSAKKIVIPTMQLVLDMGRCPESLRPVWRANEHQYIFPNGTVMVLEGADDDNGDKLRGPFAHKVICDEAGFWRHLRYVVDSILRPQALRRDGHVHLLSSSPLSKGHEFAGYINESRVGGYYFMQTVDDNPTLSPEKIEQEYVEPYRAQGGRNSTAFRREYLAELVTEEGRVVIPEFSVKRHVVPDYPRPEYFIPFVFMDLGLIDYTHVLFAYHDWLNDKLIVEDEVVQNHMQIDCTTKDLAEKIKAKEQLCWNGWGDKPWLGGHTPRRTSDNDAQIIKDMEAIYDIKFAPANKTVMRFDESLINRLRLQFQNDKILIHERCKNLIAQLENGIWNERRTDYERIAGLGHLDGIDALKYGIRDVDSGRKPIPANLGVSIHTHSASGIQKEVHPLDRLGVYNVKTIHRGNVARRPRT